MADKLKNLAKEINAHIGGFLVRKYANNNTAYTFIQNVFYEENSEVRLIRVKGWTVGEFVWPITYKFFEDRELWISDLTIKRYETSFISFDEFLKIYDKQFNRFKILSIEYSHENLLHSMASKKINSVKKEITSLQESIKEVKKSLSEFLPDCRREFLFRNLGMLRFALKGEENKLKDLKKEIKKSQRNYPIYEISIKDSCKLSEKIKYIDNHRSLYGIL